jgi:hypothetical protein
MLLAVVKGTVAIDLPSPSRWSGVVGVSNAGFTF